MRIPDRPLIAIALALTGLAYLPGLWGPFLLDDFNNLEPLALWRDGVITWQGVLLGNDSGPLGRPLSMASFLLNAAALGLEAWHFKAVNLFIHLACGVLIAGFGNRLMALDDRLRPHAGKIAVLLALWWLLLPIHSATVLYIVQRMAQLSTLFIFAGLWLYLVGRHRVATGRRHGGWMLFLGIPALTLAGALAKENAFLLPLLCGVLEFGMYRGIQRPRIVTWFLWLVVALPIVGSMIFVAVNPGFILGGFERREFTLAERLLTQTRVLWSYVVQILVPAGSGLSVFQDDVTLSTGLFKPVATAGAIAAWLFALAGAWLLRHSAPLVLTGLLLFLGGHLMESSVFALEMSFLHRNYMPSAGILVAMMGLAGLAARHLPAPSREFRYIGLIVLALAGLALWSATFARAWVWQSESSLTAYELRHNPDSVRARLLATTQAVKAGDTDAALHQVQQATPHLPDWEQGASAIWRMAAYCGTGRRIPAPLIQEFGQFADYRIGPFEREAFDTLTSHLERESCSLDELEHIAQASIQWLEETDQPDRATNVWRFRYDTARLLARSGNLASALSQAEKAFRNSGYEFPVGVLAFRLATSLGKWSAADRILDQLEAHQDVNDRRHRRIVEQFRAYLQERDNRASEPESGRGRENWE